MVPAAEKVIPLIVRSSSADLQTIASLLPNNSNSLFISFDVTEYSKFFSQYISDSFIVIPNFLITIFRYFKSSKIKLIFEKFVLRNSFY